MSLAAARRVLPLPADLGTPHSSQATFRGPAALLLHRQASVETPLHCVHVVLAHTCGVSPTHQASSWGRGGGRRAHQGGLTVMSAGVMPAGFYTEPLPNIKFYRPTIKSILAKTKTVHAQNSSLPNYFTFYYFLCWRSAVFFRQ